MEEIGKSAVNLIRGPACCGGDVIVFRPSIDAEARFLGYIADCSASVHQKACIGRGFTVMQASDASEIQFHDRRNRHAVPEQAAIVRFLDHADRRIRRYIRAQQQLVMLLEEQNQAIIHQAITGQIDVRTGRPFPAYKPSGVPWLGDVPEHWGVRRLKWVTRLQRGYDLPADRRVPGPFPVVSSGGFIGTHSESRCPGPGVAMGRYGSTEAVFYVEQDFWPHNTSLFVTHFQGNTQKWCYYILRSITKADHAGKSAVPGLDRKDLFQIVVPVPPVDEQREIVRAIEVGTHDLNNAISVTQREIALLSEYRTRLIADVVTGKLDVREAAARLPDEVEELEPLDEADALIDGEEEPTDALATVP